MFLPIKQFNGREDKISRWVRISTAIYHEFREGRNQDKEENDTSSTQFAEKYHNYNWGRMDGILRNAFTINNTDLTKHVAAEAQSSAVIQNLSNSEKK